MYIELKDLRIGNILSYKGELVHVTQLSMDIDDEYQDIIGFCKLGQTQNEISDWNRALALDLKPFSLSPEILLACGFEKDGMDYSRTAGKLKLTGFFFEDYFVTMLMGQRLVDLKYLHQLQNLYHSLTEDELIYKPTPQPA